MQTNPMEFKSLMKTSNRYSSRLPNSSQLRRSKKVSECVKGERGLEATNAMSKQRGHLV